jgi:hypothetical protein
LTLENAIRVAQGGIGFCQTGPIGGMTKMRFRKPPKRVTFADLDSGSVSSPGKPAAFASGNHTRRRSRKRDPGTGANLIWIIDPAICGEKFRPAVPVTEMLLSKAPK